MFRKSVENGHFSQNSKGGTKAKFSKMADFLFELRKAKKNRKHKSPDSLISMD